MAVLRYTIHYTVIRGCTVVRHARLYSSIGGCTQLNELYSGTKLLAMQHHYDLYALLDGTNVRLNWNIESDMNVYWI